MSEKRMTAKQIARAVAKHLKVENGDVVVLKRNANNLGDSLEIFNALRNAFGLTGRKECLIMIVDEFDDIMALGQKDMEQYGWCKCPEVRDTNSIAPEGS